MTLAIVLLVVGLGLIVAEACFPSFGALGVAAAVCLGVACVSAFAAGSVAGWTFVAVVSASVPAAIWAGFRLLPRSPLGKLLVNRGTSFEQTAAVDPRNAGLAGRAGTAESMLRPAGTARIGELRVDVVTRGEFLEPGTPLVVVEVEGNRVVVARSAAP